jgi:hypothetical protein
MRKTRAVVVKTRSIHAEWLGAMRPEPDRDCTLAPTINVPYVCPVDNKVFEMTFSASAAVPSAWECRQHGVESHRSDAISQNVKPGKAPRTHWDMLRERRTIEELEELLAERLSQFRKER